MEGVGGGGGVGGSTLKKSTMRQGNGAGIRLTPPETCGEVGCAMKLS